MPEGWKKKIQASMIANRLHDCFEGKVTIDPVALKAGLALFNKLEPDLARSELQNLDENGNKTNPPSAFNITIHRS